MENKFCRGRILQTTYSRRALLLCRIAEGGGGREGGGGGGERGGGGGGGREGGGGGGERGGEGGGRGGGGGGERFGGRVQGRRKSEEMSKVRVERARALSLSIYKNKVRYPSL